MLTLCISPEVGHACAHNGALEKLDHGRGRIDTLCELKGGFPVAVLCLEVSLHLKKHSCTSFVLLGVATDRSMKRSPAGLGRNRQTFLRLPGNILISPPF